LYISYTHIFHRLQLEKTVLLTLLTTLNLLEKQFMSVLQGKMKVKQKSQ